MSCKRLENLEIIYDELKKHNKSEIGKLLEYSVPALFNNKKFKGKLTKEQYNDLLMDEILNYIIKNEKRCKKLPRPSITTSLARRSTLKHAEIHL